MPAASNDPIPAADRDRLASIIGAARAALCDDRRAEDLLFIAQHEMLGEEVARSLAPRLPRRRKRRALPAADYIAADPFPPEEYDLPF